MPDSLSSFLLSFTSIDADAWKELGHSLAYSILGILGASVLTDKIREWCFFADFRDFDNLAQKCTTLLKDINGYYKLNEKSVLEKNWLTTQQTNINELQKKSALFEDFGRKGFFILSLLSVVLLVFTILSLQDKFMGPWVIIFASPIAIAKLYFWFVYRYFKKEYKDMLGALQKTKDALAQQSLKTMHATNIQSSISSYLKSVSNRETPVKRRPSNSWSNH